MAKSKIEWTDKTWNPIRARNLETGKVGHFCEHVSEGCRNCYAEVMQKRFGNPIRYARQDRGKVEIFLDEEVLLKPLKWRKPAMVFVCSMTDLFGAWVPEDWLSKIWTVMTLCPQHRFQILTKRSDRMLDYLSADPNELFNDINSVAGMFMDYADMPTRDDWPLRNVGLGVSVEDQKTADPRITDLLATPAAWRFVSYEPGLAAVDFTNIKTRWGSVINALTGRMVSSNHSGDVQRERLDQVIAGGESEKAGQVARPANPEWFRSARDQCLQAGVPFFFKQWGEWVPADQLGAVRFEKAGNRRRLYGAKGRLFPGKTFEGRVGEDGVFYVKVGKARAGRVLDGAIWDLQPRQLTAAQGDLL